MATCKDCIHSKICNDYVCLVGREDKIACPDFKSTEDVVPRAEVETYIDELNDDKLYLCEQIKKLEKENEILMAANRISAHTSRKIKEELDKSTNFYCSFTKSKIQECPIQDEVEKSKQEVAREIFDEIAEILKKIDRRNSLIGSDYGELLICDIGCCIGELKKKYVGEKNET